jgi:cold shock CspA family protein
VVALLVLAVALSPVWAHALTPAQLQTLKADIAADPVLSVIPKTSAGSITVANAYNQPASPAYWVWRTAVSKDELVGSTSVDGTTFAWTGAGFITRSQGERDAFVAMFSSAGTINCALASVRQAFVDIFSGATAPAPANRTHLATVCRRTATRGEKLYATNGAGTTANPSTMGFEGAITPDDVQAAWDLP